MPLPAPFRFSQSNLQDYLDCRRRFQLRHLLHLAWPAVEAEPLLEVERHLRLGSLFHRLVQQHWLGLPKETLSRMAHEEEVQHWWSNYLAQFGDPHGYLDLLGIPRTVEVNLWRRAEVTLLAPLSGHLLIAQYDALLCATNGVAPQWLILEWKTSTHRPKRSWLSERMQTRLYPYLLVRAGGYLCNGQPIEAERIEMLYWFAEFPDRPERFSYSPEQFERDEHLLRSLIAEIETLEEGDFYLTEHEERCRYCVYRSLCERGVTAADIALAEDNEASSIQPWEAEVTDFEFEQIAEIEF